MMSTWKFRKEDSILRWENVNQHGVQDGIVMGTGTSEVKVAQSCPTLCDPMDYIVHGILQARILECIAFPFSRGSSQPRDQTRVSCIAGGFFTNWAIREALVMGRRHEWWECLGSWPWGQLLWCNHCQNSLKCALKKCVFCCTWITHQSGWFTKMHSIALWHSNNDKTGHCILDHTGRNRTQFQKGKYGLARLSAISVSSRQTN